MRVTFSDFAASVIATWFLTAVFVWPWITAWHFMDKHFSNPSTYHPTTSTPRKAGATFRSEDCHRKDFETAHASGDSEPKKAVTRHLSVMSVGSLQGGNHWRERLRNGVTPRRDADPEDSSRFGLFALTHRGDPRWEMGRGGASLEGLQTLANAAAGLCGIDPALFWSLILRESSGRHWDAEGRVLRSRSNALGLGQIKASTARGVSPLLDPLKPWDNAVASACHLRSLIDANRGNVRKSLHDYHAGAYRKRTTAATLAYASDIITGSAQ